MKALIWFTLVIAAWAVVVGIGIVSIAGISHGIAQISAVLDGDNE